MSIQSSNLSSLYNITPKSSNILSQLSFSTVQSSNREILPNRFDFKNKKINKGNIMIISIYILAIISFFLLISIIVILTINLF